MAYRSLNYVSFLQQIQEGLQVLWHYEKLQCELTFYLLKKKKIREVMKNKTETPLRAADADLYQQTASDPYSSNAIAANHNSEDSLPYLLSAPVCNIITYTTL